MDLPWYLGNSREVMDLVDRIVVPLVLWQSLWKGFALWYAARRNEKGWFIALLVINLLGILEIIYLVFVAKIFVAHPSGTIHNLQTIPKHSTQKKRKRTEPS